ncbi:UNVERIFIED_CONTAM: hypothetical protein Scaly_2430500 [Sesamum calycinum]|uniref:DUF4216 domain-containing protein n=1 Tax=Sesamum calycinum TaxID=2727403 RepID=A0AAW2LZH3_9LAMI
MGEQMQDWVEKFSPTVDVSLSHQDNYGHEQKGQPSIPDSIFNDTQRTNYKLCMNENRIQGSIFNNLSQASGASEKRWLNGLERHIIETYILCNCEVVTPYYDIGNSTMNCGVYVKSSDIDNDIYGILKEIQLGYPFIPNMQIILFKCRYVDPVRGMKVHLRYHVIDVNIKKVYQKNELFILAQQAVQVYYTEYPSMKENWIG